MIYRNILVVFVGIGIFYVVNWTWNQSLEQSIDKVRLRGEFSLVDRSVVERELVELISGSESEDLLKEAKRYLLGLPGVKAVAVRRLWNAQLDVQFQEHRPLAVYNGSQLLLDDFSLEPIQQVTGPLELAELPQLQGPENAHVSVVLAFSKIRDAMTGQEIERFVGNGLEGGRVMLKGGITFELGMSDVRVRTYRMQQLVNDSTFFDRLAPGTTVDLRYIDGFSLNQPLEQEELNSNG